jgi:type II secretory pathway pseudopilin PulG
MKNDRRQFGFSLTETLLAVGTLAVGLLFIGGTFMTGVYFSSVSTERTIAAAVADEAFAKIRLYGLDPDASGLSTTQSVPFEQLKAIPTSEYLYPSDGSSSPSSGQYSWAAICRRAEANGRLIQVTVFVSRGSGANTKYWVRKTGAGATGFDTSSLPRPVRVKVSTDATTGQTRIADANATGGVDVRAFINDGASIVDDATGQIYRVLKRPADQPNRIELALTRPGGNLTPPAGDVWVVPPASRGRSPMIAVYQKVFRFQGL